MTTNRRDFLRQLLFIGAGLHVSGAALLGCGDDGGNSGGDLDAGGDMGGGDLDFAPDVNMNGCENAFAGGERLGQLEFTDEVGVQFHTVRSEGWDGRLYTQLSAVDESSPIVSNEEHFIRTLDPDQIDRSTPWQIAVTGLVDGPATLDIDALLALEQPMGVQIMECSGNSDGAAFGLLSASEWSGVRCEDVLEMISARPEATQLRVVGFDGHSVPSQNGHSTPGAAWVFTFDQLIEAGAFFATGMNGEPLPANHGEPVRLLVPGWYGCSCIKWVNELAFVDDDEPATSQMMEFASRTHQNGAPQLARDYLPASIDQTAMPIRVEQWRVNGELVYRIVGIMWGGATPTGALMIRFNQEPAQAVDVCPPPTTNAGWTLWTYRWKPSSTGQYVINMSIDDPAIRTIRLDSFYYFRIVDIDEV